MFKKARLAQLVEHLIDVERVRGSNPLSRTKFRGQNFHSALAPLIMALVPLLF